MRQIVEYPWCNPSCRIAEMRTYSDNGLYVIATPRLLVPYKRLQNRGLPSGARPSRKAQTEATLAGCLESRCRNSRCLGWCRCGVSVCGSRPVVERGTNLECVL